jgi:cytochrome c2
LKTNKDIKTSREFNLLFLCSLLLFFLIILSFNKQANTEWKHYQQEFKQYLEENIDPEAASNFEFSVKQIWLPELDRVDRCTSCHLGFDDPKLVNAPLPFTAHPDIEPHSILKMGCTICHNGQGFSLKKNKAHGEIKHWQEPLLGNKLIKNYGIKKENALIQINCNVCHRYDKETVGMDMINTAKKIIARNPKCQVCHIIAGKGGKQGPDLTFVGDKPPERFDFSQIEEKIIEEKKPLSMLTWHFEHFMKPETVVPNSKMTFVEYSEEEAWSLAMLMMSWKNIRLPVNLMPKGKNQDLLPPDNLIAKETLSTVEWGKELFKSNDCIECHSIGEGTIIGPDLKGITKTRDIEWLRKMIIDSEGMEESDQLAKKLYLEYEEAGMPSTELTEKEIDAIIKYLDSFKNE